MKQGMIPNNPLPLYPVPMIEVPIGPGSKDIATRRDRFSNRDNASPGKSSYVCSRREWIVSPLSHQKH